MITLIYRIRRLQIEEWPSDMEVNLNILNKQCQTKSQVALWQDIVPVSHPAQVSGENNGSRLLDMNICRIRQTLSLNTFKEGTLQRIYFT